MRKRKNIINAEEIIGSLDISMLLSGVKGARLKDPEKENRFVKSYSLLIDFVKTVNVYNAKTFTAIAHMVYGWMPTMLEFYEFENDADYQILGEKIRLGNLGVPDFEYLKKHINNSVVGASKFCHFINPDKYAIWDSRVSTYIFKNKAYGLVNNTHNYMCYNEKLNELKNENLDELKEVLRGKINLSGNETNLRILELSLFIASSQ
ncbi:MAG TPA: hypothetical protein VMT55_04445 [Candidatus Sulfotelmatobacter sp.]|nr:hypothetical protein [Candidatus Sulfotelmatobacter sp.]